MNARQRHAALLQLADSLGLQVRLESLDEGQSSGLCRLGRHWLILLDEQVDQPRQNDALLAALAEFIRTNPRAAARLEEIYILPELRQLLDNSPA